MEKLQAALQKARQTRDESVPAAAKKTSARGESGTPESRVDTLWADLQPLEVDDKQLEKRRVVTRDAGPSATPFDILRTKVLLLMRQNGWRRLAITSPMPDSGKTTTSCNLALGLGRQKDLRSILLDLDLRDPSVNHFFQTEPKQTIGRVLTGDVEFADQAMRIGDNVAVSMARRPETDPTRLLLSEETAEAIDKIERDFNPDLMIFDLPSVLVHDDTRAFLKNADCALIVIRANQTRYGHFDTCEREIAEQTNVLGVVLNAYTNAKTESYKTP